MMKKTKIGAVVLMAAFAMMTVLQPMTSMAAGICQTRICGGNSVNLYGTVPGNCFGQNAGSCQTGNNCKQEGSRIIVPVEGALKTGTPALETGVLAAENSEQKK